VAQSGEQGLLCANVKEAYGGNGGDWLYNVVVVEEFARAGVSGPGSGFMVPFRDGGFVSGLLLASEQTKHVPAEDGLSEMIGRDSDDRVLAPAAI